MLRIELGEWDALMGEMRLRDSGKFTDEDWKMAKKLGYDKYLERVRREVLDEE